MRSFRAIFIFFFLFLIIGGIPAQSDVLSEQCARLKIVERVLESSLIDLKRSADQLSERNQFLASENPRIKKQIDGLQEELKGLKERKAKIFGTEGASLSEPSLADASSLEKEVFKLSQENTVLGAENQNTAEKINIKQKQLDGIRQKNSALSQDTARLNNQLSSLKGKDHSREKGKTKEKDSLLLSLQEKQRRVKNLEGKGKEKSKVPPSSKAKKDQLSQAQSQLKQKIIKLERGLASLSAEDAGSFNQSQSLAENRETQAAQIDKEIELLDSRRSELGQVLARAKENLKNISLNASLEPKLKELQEKLNSLKRENEILREKISSLEPPP